MKKILFSMSAFTLLLLAACNNNDNSKASEEPKMNADTTKKATTTEKTTKEITPAFTGVDPKLAASLKTLIDHYLHIKNALINNDEKEAANGAREMGAALEKVDKSLFTPEQKKIYDEAAPGLKMNAEHISQSKIDHQREHFASMSDDIFPLVKAFGGGQPLYHDHCPMANNNSGAMWLSETKEVRNPYFGGKMNECVDVPEVVK